MTEKVSLPEIENGSSDPPAVTTVDGATPTELTDAAKHRVNGGPQAWLSVLALFCVFINSW